MSHPIEDNLTGGTRFPAGVGTTGDPKRAGCSRAEASPNDSRMAEINILILFEFPAGDKEWQVRDVMRAAQSRPQVSTLRVRHGFLREYRSGSLRGTRLLNFATMYARSAMALLFTRYDVVLVRSSPPGIQIFAGALCLLRGKEFVVWMCDHHPKIEATLWAKKAVIGQLAAVLCHLDRFIFRRARSLVAVDRAMRESLLASGARQVVLVPNWGDQDAVRATVATVRPITSPLTDATVEIVYIGNLGFAHKCGELRMWFKKLAATRRIVLRCIGTPESGWRWLLAQVGEYVLEHFIHPTCPFAELPNYTNRSRAQWGLIAFDQAYAGMMTPSKFSGYLEMGIPLLYVGPGGTMADWLCEQGAGIRLPTEQGADATEASLQAIGSEEEWKRCAARVAEAKAKLEAQNGAAEIVDLLLT